MQICPLIISSAEHAAYLNLMKIMVHLSVVWIRCNKEIGISTPSLVIVWSKFLICNILIYYFYSYVQMSDF